jgi:hypothetical protein
MQWLRTCVRAGSLLLLGGLVAIPVSAQTCQGSPAGPGAFTVGLGGVQTDGSSGGFLKGRANLSGPIAFSSRLGLEERGGGSNAFVAAGTGMVEWASRGVEFCPTAGFTHTVWTDRSGVDPVNRSELRFPMGLAVGTRGQIGDAAFLLPWVHGGLLPGRVRRSSSAASDLDTGVEAFLGGGGALQLGRVFLRAGVGITSVEGSRPAYSMELGYWIARGI